MRLPSVPITAGPTFSETRTETPSTSVEPQARLANRTRIALATTPNVTTPEKLFSGSTELLLTHLVSDRDLSDAEAERLRELLSERLEG